MTKLNSKEAGRRFSRIRKDFVPLKKRLIELCHQEGVDGMLQDDLSATEREILVSIQVLDEHRVGEREFLGTAVLTLEGILSKTKDLLLRVDLAQQTGQRLPHGFQLRVQGFVAELREGCMLLARMRCTVEEESRPAVAADGAGGAGWTSWTFWRRLFGKSNNTRVVAEEHHEREHLFTGLGWRYREECRCLDYR